MKKQKAVEQAVLVYQNKEYENQTRKELETARELLQIVLDKWLSLGLGSCSNISDLIFRPKIMYDQSISELIKVPESSGPFKLDKTKYQDQFTLPDPIELLNARNIALKQSFCAIPELWDMKDNQVVLNESEALIYINSQSIYATDERQIKFVKRLNDLISAWNEVDRDLSGILFTPQIRGSLMGKFNITDKGIEIKPESLKDWIRDLK